MKKILPIIAVLVVIVIAAWLLAGRNGSEPIGVQAPEQAGLGAQVFDQVSQNPVEGKLPDTNPLKVNVNPYADAYKNPFGQ